MTIQAALQSQARTASSKDLPDAQVVTGLRIINPFTKDWKDYL